jgi:hypothetical protein
MRWLAGLPAYALFPLFIVIGLGLTLLLDLLVRRFVDADTRERATHTAGVMLQVIATIYAILIGFVIVDKYTRLSDIQAQVSDKASALAVIQANTRELPADARGAIERATVAYTKASLESEIPHLEEDATPDHRSVVTLDALFRAVQSSDPDTAAERAAYDATLRSLDEVVHTKAELLDASRAAVPGTLLSMLFVVGIAVMGIATLLDTRHRRSHLAMVSTLGLVIWVTLALVVSLDYAFGGIISVSDAPLRPLLELLTR